jgi:hypothetical protein
MNIGQSLTRVLRYVRRGLSNRAVPVGELEAARARGDLKIEEEFFAGLRLRNGVYKTTTAHRFDTTFPLLIDSLSKLSKPTIHVLDVACSSGISTLELHTALLASGISCVTVGTDTLLSAKLVRCSDGSALLFDGASQVLQAEVGNWAVSWVWPPQKRYFLFAPIRLAHAWWLMNRRVEKFRAALRGPVATMEVSDVSLLTRAVGDAGEVHFREEDLLDPPRAPETFDLIRAANILNLNYFEPVQLRLMLEKLAERLRVGGFLFVVRELDNINRGGLYRREGRRLRLVDVINGGTEIAQLVEAVEIAGLAAEKAERGGTANAEK